MHGLAIITGGTRLSAMGTRILMLLMLAVIGLGLAAWRPPDQRHLATRRYVTILERHMLSAPKGATSIGSGSQCHARSASIFVAYSSAVIGLERQIRRESQPQRMRHLAAQKRRRPLQRRQQRFHIRPPKPRDKRRRVLQVRRRSRTSVTVMTASASSGSRNSCRANTPASTWRISSATRNCRCVGPVAAFFKPAPSPSRSTRSRRLPAGRGSWRTTSRIRSRAPLRARRP